MRFDEHGFPAPDGSEDYADSSHLAGVLAITEHPMQVGCEKYVKYTYIFCDKYYVRHPEEKRYDFSRDQAKVLMAALLKQGKDYYVRTSFIDGKDIIYPSLKGYETIARRGKPYFWQRWFAMLEVWIHATFQPLEEPNQTIADCEVYDLYDFWTSRNKLWRWSIRRYWSQLDGAWRNEPELAEHIIAYIEKKIKKP